MKARGATGTDGIAVAVVNEAIGLRGVVATKNFAKGDEVLSVPRDALILCESRADASAIREVYAPTSSGPVSEACAKVPACARTALLLLWLSYSDPGEWKPSFDILPTAKSFAADGGPLELWSSNEVEACGCLILEAQVAARQSELRKLYDEVIAPGWPAAAENYLNQMPLPTYEDFQLAVVVITSRAYGEAPQPPKFEGGSTSMLVPGADLFNHESPGKTNVVKGLAPWGSFVVVADRDIRVGEEVFISYGALPNRQLVAQFGFMLPGAGQQALEHPTVSLDGAPGGVAALDGAALEELCGLGWLARSARGPCSTLQLGGKPLQEACSRLGVNYGSLLAKAAEAQAARGAEAENVSESSEEAASPRQRLAREYRTAQAELLRKEAARVGV